MNEAIIESSGNVFADLGFPPDQAAVLQMRAALMVSLARHVQDHGWTQEEAARHLLVSQSRVSDLMRRKWDKFSLDMLVTLAIRAGLRVDMHLAA